MVLAIARRRIDFALRGAPFPRATGTSDPSRFIDCRCSGVVQSCNARWKSAIRSSGCSIPTETRSVEAVIPASRRAASVIDA